MAGALHDLSRAIGALENGVANLTKMVDEERADASKHRQSLRETISALAEAVRTLTNEVAMMKPVVEDYREKASEAKGRAKLGRVLQAIWLSLSGAVVALFTWAIGHWK